MPIKDQQARRSRQRCLISRRQPPHLQSDAVDTFEALLAWARLAHQQADGPLTGRPVFTMLPGGEKPIDTALVRQMVREAAAQLGRRPTDYGASSLRIGGATDIRAALGDSSERLIAERGRWDSDIGKIYARAVAETHADVSVMMADAGGWAEEAITGLAQPAI